LISSDVCDDGGDDVRDDDFQSHFQHIRGINQAVRHIGFPALTARISSLPCASCAFLPKRWLRSHPQLNLTPFQEPLHQLYDRGSHHLLLQLAWLQGLSRHQGLGHHQGRNQHGRHCKEVDWDKLVRLHTEVEGMEVGTVLGPVEGMENLVVGMEVVVDMGLGSEPESDLRSLAEAGIDSDSHPVVARNSGQEGIGIEEDIALEEGIVADRKVVGCVEADLRNSCCST